MRFTAALLCLQEKVRIYTYIYICVVIYMYTDTYMVGYANRRVQLLHTII